MNTESCFCASKNNTLTDSPTTLDINHENEEPPNTQPETSSPLKCWAALR